MPDSAGAVVFSCPNCGSSIAMEGERGICAFCGTAIERPARARTGGRSGWPPTINPVPRAARAGARRGVPPGVVLALVAFAALAGFLIGRALTSARVVSQASLPSSTAQPSPAPPVAEISGGSVSDLAAVLPKDGPGGDPLVFVYHSGKDNSSFYTVARIDGATHTPRWQSESLGKNGGSSLLAVDGGTLYLANADRLLALRLSDGATAWQAALDVEPPGGCAECLRVVGERVLVLEKNGALQAFDARSGERAWGTRLENTPRRLPAIGGRVLTPRDRSDNHGQDLVFLDAASGKPALQLSPSCPKAHESFDDERPASDTPFLFSADGRTMYAIYGFFAKCAQSWDLASGKLRWQVALDDRQSPASWDRDILQTGDALYVGSGGLLWALDTSDGAARTLVEDKEYNLTPLAARDGMLIALASPTWDSQRKLLWGLDARTGERHWQLKLQARELIAGTSSGDWDFRLTQKGLTVLQVLRDDAKLVVETLNPRTGASLGRQENALEGAHMPGLYRAIWGDDSAWLEVDSDVFAVDLASGKIAYRLS